MNMVIGVTGLARAGKDTVAGHLRCSWTGAIHPSSFAFADPIRAMLSVGLGISDWFLDEGKDEVHPLYGVTVRHMMQTLGTEWGRGVICDDVWLKAMDNRVCAAGGPVIITDVRFENEAQFVRERGVLVHVQRPGTVLAEGADHVSEAGIIYRPDDLKVVNDGTWSDLAAKSQLLAKELRV
ncbi:deoxynucleotide monophosphate kinase [bacterium]|nr:deoxynucleotide monophosphate kinase [bacterium]